MRHTQTHTCSQLALKPRHQLILKALTCRHLSPETHALYFVDFFPGSLCVLDEVLLDVSQGAEAHLQRSHRPHGPLCQELRPEGGAQQVRRQACRAQGGTAHQPTDLHGAVSRSGVSVLKFAGIIILFIYILQRSREDAGPETHQATPLHDDGRRRRTPAAAAARGGRSPQGIRTRQISRRPWRSFTWRRSGPKQLPEEPGQIQGAAHFRVR